MSNSHDLLDEVLLDVIQINGKTFKVDGDEISGFLLEIDGDPEMDGVYAFTDRYDTSMACDLIALGEALKYTTNLDVNL